MNWTIGRHDVAPTLIGVEAVDQAAPAGQVGIDRDGVTARFDPSTTPPRLTALWIGAIAPTPFARTVLEELPEALRSAFEEPPEPGELRQVDDGRDAAPDGDRLSELGREALSRRLARLPNVPAEARSTTVATATMALSRFANAAVEADGATAEDVPIWFGGLDDEVVTQLGSLVPTLSVARDGEQLIVDLPDGVPNRRDLFVRVVDGEEGGTPEVVAVVAVDEARVVIDHVPFPDSTRLRVELVDTSLRPVLRREQYDRAVVEQTALMGLGLERIGDVDSARALVAAAADAYAVVAEGDLAEATHEMGLGFSS